jgi:hypothetical protein
LPDQYCRVWVFEPKEKGQFRGWYSGEKGKEVVEEFEVGPVEDTVAYALGETKQVGTITAVFFHPGWPDRSAVAVHRRPYIIDRQWNEVAKRWEYHEGEMRETDGAAAMAGPQQFGTVAGQARSAALQYKSSPQSGPILASMTIHYAPQSQITRMLSGRDTSTDSQVPGAP